MTKSILDQLDEAEKAISSLVYYPPNERAKYVGLLNTNIRALIDVAKAAEKVNMMVNMEEDHEGYIDTDTAADLAEALAKLNGGAE